ncbi:MAG: exonuclease 1-like protein [Amphiamblys sp. WSBS2006]|nr:MAG: exonuclease 1-like protein [Amphiamblys sp. WSBS2006]
MGIDGLKDFLKNKLQRTNFFWTSTGEYKRKTLGVDANNWVYPFIWTNSVEIQNKGMTEGLKRELLAKVEIQFPGEVGLVFVFDGAPFPLKIQHERRTADVVHDSSEGIVTAELIRELARILSEARRIRCIIAPFEADPQLVYLERINAIDCVVTRDVDFIVWGCKEILFDLDDQGNGMKFCSLQSLDYEKLDLKDMIHEEFVRMCILAGCDYLKRIPKIRKTTPYSLFKKNKIFKNVKMAITSNTESQIPKNYWDDFRKAELVFKHYLVYDTITPGRRINMTPIDERVADEMGRDFSFLGGVEGTVEGDPPEFTVLGEPQPNGRENVSHIWGKKRKGRGGINKKRKRR